MFCISYLFYFYLCICWGEDGGCIFHVQYTQRPQKVDRFPEAGVTDFYNIDAKDWTQILFNKSKFS